MPTKEEVIASIRSGELLTHEYQEACRQRKAAALLMRKDREIRDNAFYTKLWEENKHKGAVDADADVYTGKKSGDFVGD